MNKALIIIERSKQFKPLYAIVFCRDGVKQTHSFWHNYDEAQSFAFQLRKIFNLCNTN